VSILCIYVVVLSAGKIRSIQCNGISFKEDPCSDLLVGILMRNLRCMIWYKYTYLVVRQIFSGYRYDVIGRERRQTPDEVLNCDRNSINAILSQN
jgi:hypothetical protein